MALSPAPGDAMEVRLLHHSFARAFVVDAAASCGPRSEACVAAQAALSSRRTQTGGRLADRERDDGEGIRCASLIHTFLVTALDDPLTKLQEIMICHCKNAAWYHLLPRVMLGGSGCIRCSSLRRMSSGTSLPDTCNVDTKDCVPLSFRGFFQPPVRSGHRHPGDLIRWRRAARLPYKCTDARYDPAQQGPTALAGSISFPCGAHLPDILTAMKRLYILSWKRGPGSLDPPCLPNQEARRG